MFWFETITLVVDATLNLENKSWSERFVEVSRLIFTETFHSRYALKMF